MSSSSDILYGHFPTVSHPGPAELNWREIRLDPELIGLYTYFEEMQSHPDMLFCGSKAWGAACPLLPDTWTELGTRYYLEPEGPLSDRYRLQQQLILDTLSPDHTDYLDTVHLEVVESSQTSDGEPDAALKLAVSIERPELNSQSLAYSKGEVKAQQLLAVEHLALPLIEGECRWAFFDMRAFKADFRPQHGSAQDVLLYLNPAGNMIGWVHTASYMPPKVI